MILDPWMPNVIFQLESVSVTRELTVSSVTHAGTVTTTSHKDVYRVVATPPTPLAVMTGVVPPDSVCVCRVDPIPTLKSVPHARKALIKATDSAYRVTVIKEDLLTVYVISPPDSVLVLARLLDEDVMNVWVIRSE